METYPDVCGSWEGRPHQSLMWNKNSCAFDSVLSILPGICLQVARKSLFGYSVLGKDAVFHSPAASLLVAMQALRESSTPMLHSNWVRHLALDIVCFGKGNESLQENRHSWSAFSGSNPYSCLGDTIWMLQYLFGKGCSRFKENYLPVFEIPSSCTSEVFKNIQLQRSSDHTTMASFLFHALVDFNRNLKSGLYFTSVATNCPNYREWLQHKFQTDWEGTFEIVDCHIKWNVRLTAVLGSTSTSSDHFASASCHYLRDQHLEFFNGMVDGGKANVLKAPQVIGSQLVTDEMFLVFIVHPDEKNGSNRSIQIPT